jgi:hypothetical protein
MPLPNPYSPPTSRVEDAGRARLVARRPRQIVLATALLWIAFALDMLALYREVQRSADAISPAGALVVGTLSAFAVAVNVSVWRGRNWARVVYAVLTILAFVMVSLDPATADRALHGVTMVIGAGVLCLLFTKPGSLWFRYSR